MLYLQARAKSGVASPWVTYLASEECLGGRSKLYHAMERYKRFMDQENSTEWRVVSDDDLVAQAPLPFLEREASGPLVFMVLCMFCGLIGVLASIAWMH